MLPALLSLVALLLSAGPLPCERGCLVGEDGWTYEFKRSDVVVFAKALYCESGRGIPGPEGETIAWTLVHRF